MLKKLLFIVFFGLLGTLMLPGAISAQSTQLEDDFGVEQILKPTDEELSDVYYKAMVMKIVEEGKTEVDGQMQDYQKLEVEILNGEQKGKIVKVNHGLEFVIGTYKKLSIGDKVVLAKPAITEGGKEFYYIIDQYRLPSLILMASAFFLVAIFFGRQRGLTSIIGMMFTIFILFYFIVPRILKGGDPLMTTIIGAVIIVLISIYLSHGFNRRTSIALVSTLISLLAAVIIDLLFVKFAGLSGNGTEEAFFLQFDTFKINLQGLLLAGILIGVLGVLDDITTAQSAAIEEIHLANPTLGFSDLYKKGLSIGREHIASLINTLVLAYAGASFPLLLLYGNKQLQPLWVTLNSNFISEEIVRSLVGSFVLVIAVPTTTALACFFYTRKKAEKPVTVELPIKEQLEKFWTEKK